jgi:hypothetical protein
MIPSANWQTTEENAMKYAYDDLAIYREEKDPVNTMRDTLDCLAAGANELDIMACLTRTEWVLAGHQMLRRLAMREAEKRAEAEWFAKRSAVTDRT